MYEVLDEIARRQRGLVARRQLLTSGWTAGAIRCALASGRLIEVHPGVYRLPGFTMGYLERCVAACLAAGADAAASHRAALLVWGLLDGVQPVEITVLRPQGPVPRDVIVHRPLDLRPDLVVVRNGVRVTTPARALVDGGAVLPAWQLGRCVEVGLNLRLVTVAGLRTAIDQHSRRGRNGVGVLRRYLDHRALGDRRPESVREPLMARLCRDHGVGPIEYQPKLVLSGIDVRPDTGILKAMLAVEIDGLDTHGSRDALDNDLTRQNLLVEHGYEVLRYTSTHLRRPRQVADQIIRVARRRLALLGGSAVA